MHDGAVGVHNFLVEGVSGTGKTSVCHELRRRGFHAVNGDVDLAYQGDPETGLPTDTASHEHHIWDVRRVQQLVSDDTEPMTFLCGGSRNVMRFVDLLDGVFVLHLDLETLKQRLDTRVGSEWGADPAERALVLRLHRTGEDVPDGIRIDATAPLEQVVDEIVGLAQSVT